MAFERRVAVSDARPPAAPPPAAQPGGATATRRFFSGGWAFFLPYLSLYLLGFLLGWTNATVRTAFWVCHAVVMAGFSVFSYRSLRSRYGHPARLARDPAFWFWTLLALGFILPGAYLEFPSDPWEHFRRLHAWDPAVPLRHSPWVQKFAYFWGWTFFSLIQPKHQRLAADLYSAFWQMLLAVQLHRFAFRLIRSSTWAKIHVVGAIALFGNNTFSFFRYYALASTPLAYIAYLAAAIAVLDLLEGRAPARRALPTILAATVLVAVNHLEELLLVALFSLAAAFAIFWPRLSPRVRFVIAAAASASFLTSLLAGRGAMADPAAFGLTPGHFFQPYISEVGMFRLWDPRLSYFQTIGLPGMVAVFLALFLWRSHRLVSALTLAPVVALLYPGFAIPFANHVGEYSPVSGLSFTYRVLFLLPTSVMLITAFHGFAQERARRSGWSERPVQVAALATIILLGFHETSPVFGKLRFQYHRPSEWLQARYVDTVAQWLYERRPGQPWCHVTSDVVTESVLVSFFGGPVHVDRLNGFMNPGYRWSISSAWERPDEVASYSPCGFLVLNFRPGPWKQHRSHYGPLSGHWVADRADPTVRMPAGLRETVPLLRAHGWTKTFVPPFYWYYEPPPPGPRASSAAAP